jgi:hypothetical protein
MGYKPLTNRKETSPGKRRAVWTRYLDGHSVPAIMRLENLPCSTVRSIIERAKLCGSDSFKSRPRSGALKITTDRDDRALLRAANKDTKASLYALATLSKSTKRLGRNTVRKILRNAGKRKRRPRKKPFLKPEHKKARLIWCKEEKRLKRDYNKVCWSDEVTFHIGEDGNVCYVTRASRKDEEWLEKNLQPSFKSGRTSVGVWSCYCGDEIGPLVIIEKGGTMTAARYLETVKKYYLPFIRRMKAKYGRDVVMQEDNASWHKAKLVTRYLDRQKVKRLR